MPSAASSGTPGLLPIRLEWLAVLAGLLLLYLPTFYEAGTTFWQSDEHAHAPIILAVVLWLAWRQRAAMLDAPIDRRSVAGIAALLFGLLLYVVGRSQDISLLEIGSLIPVVAGTLLALRGPQALRAWWFPLLFVAFMLPLPGFFVDALTGPLKQYISVIVEQVLYTAGYPIARTGVMLTIGQYQMLVADACSGLNTMFSLSALGLLFMYLTARASVLHNAIMLVGILPIAFVANIVRVLVLMLVTYHFGDEAGQGYLHGAAGVVLLMSSLTVLLALDAFLAWVIRPVKKSRG
ncbi:MAG: exosortase B [Burkholderiales bacterium]|nr:exosortase B [Burkholderiales bacterium]MDP2398593.1 exosortase B [Burkholderiales bacterium]